MIRLQSHLFYVVFVEDSQRVGEELKDLIKVLLLERLSLRGICRVTGVSLTWLLHFITELYCALPDGLNGALSQVRKSAIRLVRLEAEADEIWSFVVSKENKHWVWIALDIETKQILAFYVGDRSACSAKELWRRIPQVYRDHATFYLDLLSQPYICSTTRQAMESESFTVFDTEWWRFDFRDWR